MTVLFDCDIRYPLLKMLAPRHTSVDGIPRMLYDSVHEDRMSCLLRAASNNFFPHGSHLCPFKIFSKDRILMSVKLKTSLVSSESIPLKTFWADSPPDFVTLAELLQVLWCDYVKNRRGKRSPWKYLSVGSSSTSLKYLLLGWFPSSGNICHTWNLT